MSSFKRGDWTLDWEHHGEGYFGDYGEVPGDKPLLRADLLFRGKMCVDGSYCTLAPDDTPKGTLKRFSNDLFDKLEDGVKNIPDFIDWETTAEDRFDEVRFNDRVMQEWTWRTDPTDPACNPFLKAKKKKKKKK